MDSNLLNISKIETFFDGLLNKKLSSNIFYDKIPMSMKESWKEMVIVDVSFVRDLGGKGEGMVNIFLYAKPMGDSRRNVKYLSMLEKRLNDIISSSRDEHYQISRDRSYSDYDHSRRLDCTVVSIILQIF